MSKNSVVDLKNRDTITDAILWQCASDPPKSEAFGGKNPVHMLFWVNYTP